MIRYLVVVPRLSRLQLERIMCDTFKIEEKMVKLKKKIEFGRYDWKGKIS